MREDIIKKLKSWNANELKDLLEIILKSDIEFINGKKRNEIFKEIIEKYGNEDVFNSFLLHFESLKDISINKAVKCLIDHFKIHIDEARRIKRRNNYNTSF